MKNSTNHALLPVRTFQECVRLHGNRCVVVDTEFCVVSKTEVFLLQFAAVQCVMHKDMTLTPTDREWNFIIEKQRVTNWVADMTGITKEVIDHDGIPIDSAKRSIARAFRVPVIGQNIQEDIRVINIFLNKTLNRKATEYTNIITPYRTRSPFYADTLALSKELYGEEKSLDKLAVLAGAECEKRHDAMSDVSTTIQVWNFLIRQYTEQEQGVMMQSLVDFSSTEPMRSHRTQSKRKAKNKMQTPPQNNAVREKVS